MHNNHLSALRNKHAELEQKLAREENRPLPDNATILDLKKQKLHLNEAILHETASTG